MTQVFLNYRTDDDPFGVAMLDRALSDRFGPAAVFLASKSIPLGSNWEREMFEAIARSTAVLVVMGRQWLNARNRRRLDDPDDLVRREIRHALDLGKQIIPVRLAIPRPKKANLPDALAGLLDGQDIEVRFRSARIDVDLLATKLTELIPALRDVKAASSTAAAGNRVVRAARIDQLFQGDFTVNGDFNAGSPRG